MSQHRPDRPTPDRPGPLRGLARLLVALGDKLRDRGTGRDARPRPRPRRRVKK
jgi:hypothetical protein